MHRHLIAVCVLASACHGGPGSDKPGGSIDGPGDPVTGTACAPPGSTETCCDGGTRTCQASGELETAWGPCISPSGQTLSCSGCGAGEFGGCDAGMPGQDAYVLPPPPMLCQPGGVNKEPGILAAYLPGNGQTVGANGQIKVWVNDEAPEIIATGEQVDHTTGAITAPGDRTATAPDGYLWEPAVYIAPQSAETGGTPHFPSYIRGYFNNNLGQGIPVYIPGTEVPPPGTPPFQSPYTTEVVWDVSALGLAPNTYIAEFVIHDGDREHGVGCVTISIQ
jgi:hypothetical protein